MIERSYSRTYVTNYSIPRSASTFIVAAPVTLARSSTTVFTSSPRTYHPSSTYTPPISPRIGVVGSTPHYTDRYPYVRYSGYSPGPVASHSLGSYYSPTPRRSTFLETTTVYQPRVSTVTTSYSRRPSPSSSSGSYRMNVDDAVNMYKKHYLSAGQLSKYWLTPKYWENRREREKRFSSTLATGGYSDAYYTRYL